MKRVTIYLKSGATIVLDCERLRTKAALDNDLMAVEIDYYDSTTPGARLPYIRLDDVSAITAEDVSE